MEKINPAFLNHLSQMNQIKGQISENNLALIGSAQNNQVQFKDIMSQVLNNVNDHQKFASSKVTAIETGKSDDLVGAMIATQKASLSFSGLMEVRNKLVTAFEEIYKMPV